MPLQMRTRHGLPYSFAANMPFVSTPPVSSGGIYLGTRFDRRPMVVHPYEQYNEGGTFATTWLITGQIGHRKSGLKKQLALRGNTLVVGKHEDGTPRFMKIRMHGRRHVDDHCENDPTIQAIGGHTISLARQRIINFFDPFVGMDLADQVEVAIMVAENGANHKVNAMEAQILQIGIWKLRKLPPVSAVTGDVVHTLERFAQLVEDITIEEYKLYSDEVRSALVSEDATKFRNDPELLVMLNPSLQYNTDTLLEREKKTAVYQAKINMSAALKRVLGGDFGFTFGGGNMLSDVFGGEAINWDWLGMTLPARVLMERFQWKVLQVAHEKGLYDLIPDMNLSDEAQEAMSSPEYAAQRSRALAVTRSFSTFDVETTQYARQISKQGDHDSALRAYGETIMQTVSTRIMARIESSDEVGNKELKDLGFSPASIKRMHHLHPGQFAMKYTGRTEPVFFSLDQTDLEAPLLFTKQAVEKMLELPYDQENDYLVAQHKRMSIRELATMAASRKRRE